MTTIGTDPNSPMAPDQAAKAEHFISQMTALAMNPAAGESFELGGKTFTRQFLTIDAEQELTALVVSLMVATQEKAQNVAEAFLGSTKDLVKATAIILVDQDPTCTEDWLRTTRGITTLKLVNIVIAQLALNDVVPLLGKLLTIAGAARLVAGPRGS